MLYHGTSLRAVDSIQRTGLRIGSSVTPGFDFAASYALRHADPAILVVEGWSLGLFASDGRRYYRRDELIGRILKEERRRKRAAKNEP